MNLEWLDRCNLCASTKIECLDREAQLWRGLDCGYVFANPRPSFEEIIRFYSRPDKYAHWLSNMRSRDAIWRRRVRRIRGLGSAASLLDVGAGIGQFLHHAEPYFACLYGTEVSASAVRLAREKYGIALFQGILETIDALRDRTFDRITLFHVLEHVPDPKRLVQQCRARLNPTGLLIVAVPNELRSLKTRTLALKIKVRARLGLSLTGYRAAEIGMTGIGRVRLTEAWREAHLSYFTPAVLATCLTDAGLCVIENSLDWVNLGTRWGFVRHELYYRMSEWTWRSLGENIYDAIWIVARKI